VITAYANVFSAKYPDPNQRLRSLENAAAFRASFVERMNSLGAIVNQTSVRIDSMTADGPNAVNLTYTILLKGAPVLDDLPGRAVRQQGTWLVAAKTYCSVATLGTKTVPAACQ
jgi:hypothetical protein